MATLAIALVDSPAAAVVLRHQVTASDTPESQELGRACYGLQIEKTRLICHGAPQLLRDGARIEAGVLIKANERAYSLLNRALSKDIDQEYLDDLFREESFQDVSGHATLRAQYGGTSWSFTPIHAMGAFKLVNPSLPEIHVSAASQSVLRLSQNVLVSRWPLGGSHELLLTPSLYYFNRQYAFLSTDILSAATADVGRLTKRTTERRADGDFGIDFLARRALVPSLGLYAFDVATAKPCEICKDRLIDLEPLLRRRAEATASVAIDHPIGQSLIAATVPFRGEKLRGEALESGVSYAYRLSRLGCYVAYAPLIYRFGFVFDAEGYRLGVLYTDEKQDNGLELERRKQTYVYTSAYL